MKWNIYAYLITFTLIAALIILAGANYAPWMIHYLLLYSVGVVSVLYWRIGALYLYWYLLALIIGIIMIDLLVRKKKAASVIKAPSKKDLLTEYYKHLR